jgi:hypothetical protein
MKKNENLILQIVLILSVVGGIIIGCSKKPEPIPKDGDKIENYGIYSDLVKETSGRGYKIIVIDSCEYIYAWFGGGYGGGSLTHKGNCKFCKERLKLWKN